MNCRRWFDVSLPSLCSCRYLISLPKTNSSPLVYIRVPFNAPSGIHLSVYTRKTDPHYYLLSIRHNTEGQCRIIRSSPFSTLAPRALAFCSFRAWLRSVATTNNELDRCYTREVKRPRIKAHCENQLIYAKLLPLAICISVIPSLSPRPDHRSFR